MRETPTPSPWQSLARFAMRLLYVLILATVLWSLWYAYAAHCLNGKLAEYRARGEPASLQDFVHEAVPAADNAEALAFAAGESLKFTADERELVDSPTSSIRTMLPLSAAQVETARKMISDHEPTLSLLRKAALAHDCAMPFDPVHIEKNWTHLSGFRLVSEFLRIVALYHHQEGRDDLALSDIREMQKVADAMSAGPFLIDNLVAGSLKSLTSETVMQVAPDLMIKTSAAEYGAPREGVLQIARDFLDQASFQEELRICLRSERLFDILTLESELHSHRWLIPLFRLDAMREIQDQDSRIAAISPGVPPFPVARSRFPLERPVDSNLEGAAFLLSGNSASINRAILLHYRVIIDREAAGLRLCIRLYELEHGGQKPRRLSDLVPAYMSSLPIDVLRSTGDPFVYDETKHIFYSVGENDIDDGGDAGAGHRTWAGKDVVYSLDRPALPPPPTAASTEESAEPATAPDPVQ